MLEREVTGALNFGSNDVIIDAGLARTGLAQLHNYMARADLSRTWLLCTFIDHGGAGYW